MSDARVAIRDDDSKPSKIARRTSFADVAVSAVGISLLHAPWARVVSDFLVLASAPVAIAGGLLYAYRPDFAAYSRRATWAFLREHSPRLLMTYLLCFCLAAFLPWSCQFLLYNHIGYSKWIYEIYNSYLFYFNSYSPISLPVIVLMVVIIGPTLLSFWIIGTLWLYFTFGLFQFMICGASFAWLTGAFPPQNVFRLFSPLLQNPEPLEGGSPPSLGNYSAEILREEANALATLTEERRA